MVHRRADVATEVGDCAAVYGSESEEEPSLKDSLPAGQSTNSQQIRRPCLVVERTNVPAVQSSGVYHLWEKIDC